MANSITYFDKVVRGSEHEDGLVILQFLKGMIGESFSFLNYYKEIPVSYDARLLSIENGMAEFELHEYQAKIIALDKQTLIRSHKKNTVPEDMVAEAFYVNVSRKKAVLTNFKYARIRSDLRRYVRVCLDGRRADAVLHLENSDINATVRDISLCGVALRVTDTTGLEAGSSIRLDLKLEQDEDQPFKEIELLCTVTRIIGEPPNCICIVEFESDRNTQQVLAYYINQRQVEIIKELKVMSD